MLYELLVWLFVFVGFLIGWLVGEMRGYLGVIGKFQVEKNFVGGGEVCCW